MESSRPKFTSKVKFQGVNIRKYREGGFWPMSFWGKKFEKWEDKSRGEMRRKRRQSL
jgi:hypothetical protein